MKIEIRELKIDDLYYALELIWDVFIDCESKYTNEEGRKEFKSFLDYEYFKNKLNSINYPILGAYAFDELVGVIGSRPPCHISLFFVKRSFQKKGVGRALLGSIREHFKNNTNYVNMTVNSSIGAVRAYEKFSFKKLDTEKKANELRYIPMCLKI